MATNPVTLTKVKALTTKVEKLSKDVKALKVKLDFTIKELETQIKAKGTASIKLLLPALEEQTAQLEDQLVPLKAARKLAEEVGTDSGYTAEHVQAVVKLTKQIDENEATLNALVKASRTIEISAEKSLGEGSTAEDKGEVELSKFLVHTRSIKAEAQKTVMQLKTFDETADKAYAARLAPKLKTAKNGACTVIFALRGSVSRNDDMLATFRKDFLGKSTAAAARARWEGEVKDTQKERDYNVAMLAACEIMYKKIDDLSLVPVDAKKSASVAGIDAAHAAELEKAMKGDDATRLKNLKALAEKLKLKVNGQEMFNRLRKAKHI